MRVVSRKLQLEKRNEEPELGLGEIDLKQWSSVATPDKRQVHRKVEVSRFLT